MTKAITLALLLTGTSALHAQDTDVVSSFASSLTNIKQEISQNYTRSSSVSPYYFRLLDPGVYNSSAAKHVMALSDDTMLMNC